MDTAPRTVTSWSGNSRRAVSEAEYTDAPLSFTMVTITPSMPSPLQKPRASRPPVPLPTAIALKSYFSRSFLMTLSDSVFFLWGSSG